MITVQEARARVEKKAGATLPRVHEDEVYYLFHLADPPLDGVSWVVRKSDGAVHHLLTLKNFERLGAMKPVSDEIR